MGQILAVAPEFTEVLTWILHYGDSATTPHSGRQPLIASITTAYKSGASSTSSMSPPANAAFVGAMWYRPVPTSCSGGDVPRGARTGLNVVNNAIVLPAPWWGWRGGR
ncbi:uncharacterized protein GGS25DRAFT_525825 [Hypoxylon fragiforme]|uniref:uncharacterized protein n=1 Tax=Hypoxylon fragiforme TaxID=63214 RepID=UPI0020C69AD2|nr:uncharacterized protein GGS25DRAFT_525825 [Hypoxylon fragiforme]KAI2604536.1 hypothetical protein GGS25DRAFT_525825 [Hypoxylon fragiforme]